MLNPIPFHTLAKRQTASLRAVNLPKTMIRRHVISKHAAENRKRFQGARNSHKFHYVVHCELQL